MSETTQLAQIEDVSAVVSVLTAAGLDADASASKAELLGTCASALREAGHDGETQVRPFFLPGRIDVFGRHADYPGGSTTLAATNRGFCYVAATARSYSGTGCGVSLGGTVLGTPDLAPFARECDLSGTIYLSVGQEQMFQ